MNRTLSQPKAFRQSELYHRWYNSVGSGGPNDYIILITAHPGFTGTSGTGKTMQAASMAVNYFHTAGEWDPDKHYTCDLDALNNELYPNAEPGTCLVGDEMQGTVANPNFNKKRFMTEEALEGYAAIAGNRKNRVTLILVFQSLKQVNTDLFDFADSWILIVDDQKYLANHHHLYPNVYDIEDNTLKTPYIESLTWDPIDEDGERYAKMEEKKEMANNGVKEWTEADEEDEELPKEVQAELAWRIKQAEDIPWNAVPDQSERITYSGDYLRRVWKDVVKDEENRKEAAA